MLLVLIGLYVLVGAAGWIAMLPHTLAAPLFEWQELGPVAVKGKAEPLNEEECHGCHTCEAVCPEDACSIEED